MPGTVFVSISEYIVTIMEIELTILPQNQMSDDRNDVLPFWSSDFDVSFNVDEGRMYQHGNVLHILI